MPKRVPVVEHSMEFQAELRSLRAITHPMWLEACRTGNYALMSEVKAIAATLRVAQHQAQRIAAIAEAPGVCADGLFEPGHGKAA